MDESTINWNQGKSHTKTNLTNNPYLLIDRSLYSFVMFSLLLLVMSVSWLFLILSWIEYDGLLYAHIIVNSVQAPLILYICVLRQKHVKFLLKKTCCYNEPPSASDWGDEMSYMNGGDYWGTRQWFCQLNNIPSMYKIIVEFYWKQICLPLNLMK